MLEVYLFINPISETCYQVEKRIIDLLNHSHKKVRFRVLPLLTLNTVKTAMQQAGISHTMRNVVVETLYHATLDYEAALFQGQKRGRSFLLHMQELMIQNDFDYSELLVKNIVTASRIDWEMFKEDRHSKLAVKAFHKNQQLAAEMQIENYPTVVINNTDYPDYAFSIDPWQSFNVLQKLILQPSPNKAHNHSASHLHSIKLKE